ncbi:MAG: VWA domain-containing protein, partial [Planctomycetaceae bacterium]
MIQFETPEFLLLAFPLWYVFHRWGKLPRETAWLLAVPAYGVFFSWKLPADADGWFPTTLRFARDYGWAALPLPLWFALRTWARTTGVTHWLRLALVTLCLFGLAGPRWNIGGKGVDVIVVVDRSRSLPKRADKDVVELIDALRDNRAPGDRVAVITFGRKPHTEQGLSATQNAELFSKNVLPDGSDLEAALQRALDLADGNRPARILVLSDGEANGPSPYTAARRAREDGVPIDFIGFHAQAVGDVAVRNVTLPETVRPNEPFQFRAVIQSDGDATAKVTLQRDSIVGGQILRRQVATRTRTLSSGRNEVVFGDVLPTGGTYRFRIDVDVDGDPRPQNNHWADEVFVDAGPRLLLLVKDEAAKSGRLARILTNPKNGVPTDVAIAERQPLTKLQLDRYRGVVIENVPADRFGFLKMARLAKFVADRGGGLLMTGGENSFGTGGYFKSPLDEILPVSMELREEHRKLRVAIVVVLDRSGSMQARASGGRTKMELANLGTEECVRLLSRNDMVSVISVDTSAHVEQPLTPVIGKEAIYRKIRGIRSTGGGIYVDVALKAAEKELEEARQRGYSTRHVILFSDARDTEISGGLGRGNAGARRVVRHVGQMKTDGVTVSIIGLGTDTDVHAGLLKAIAKAGGGNAMFADDARDLPRLFSQDTMNIARNTFLRKDDEHPDGFAAAPRSEETFLIGELGDGPFPNVDGYNLTYLRKQTAQAAIVSGDEYKAP